MTVYAPKLFSGGAQRRTQLGVFTLVFVGLFIMDTLMLPIRLFSDTIKSLMNEELARNGTTAFSNKKFPSQTLFNADGTFSVPNAMARKVNGNNTVFLAVADWKFHAIGELWYLKLQKLGYKSPTLLTVDNATATLCQEHNISYLTLVPLNCTVDARNLLRPQRYRHLLFGSRWLTVHKLLTKGYHVLLSDVDNMFQRHLSMSELESSHVDIFHAHGGGYPVHIEKSMGFTFCGGQGWYRSTPATIKFVEMLLTNCNANWRDATCGIACDDQQVLNALYSKSLDMQRDQSELYSTTGTVEEEDNYWKNRVQGFSPVTGHRLETWSMDLAYRGASHGGGSKHHLRCPRNTWVAMPTPNYVDPSLFDNFTQRIAPNDITDSTARAKWEILARWEDQCGSNRSMIPVEAS